MQTTQQPHVTLTIEGGIGETCLLRRVERYGGDTETHVETCDSLDAALQSARLHKSRYLERGWTVED